MHEGHRKRVRERYQLTGLDGFADHEVLELLLFYANKRGDTNQTAHNLINTFGSLADVLEAPFEELINVPDVGEVAATLLTMMPNLFRRYTQDKLKNVAVVAMASQAVEYLMPKFFGLSEERVAIICTDAQNKVNNFCFVSHGSLSLAQVDVRQIAQTALRNNAYNVILAHNHPGGVAAPSQSDIETTKAVVSAFKAIGVHVSDHVILNDTEGFAMSTHPRFSAMFR